MKEMKSLKNQTKFKREATLEINKITIWMNCLMRISMKSQHEGSLCELNCSRVPISKREMGEGEPKRRPGMRINQN